MHASYCQLFNYHVNNTHSLSLFLWKAKLQFKIVSEPDFVEQFAFLSCKNMSSNNSQLPAHPCPWKGSKASSSQPVVVIAHATFNINCRARFNIYGRRQLCPRALYVWRVRAPPSIRLRIRARGQSCHHFVCAHLCCVCVAIYIYIDGRSPPPRRNWLTDVKIVRPRGPQMGIWAPVFIYVRMGCILGLERKWLKTGEIHQYG